MYIMTSFDDLAPDITFSSDGWLNTASLEYYGNSITSDTITNLINSTEEGVSDYVNGLDSVPDDATTLIRNNEVEEGEVSETIEELLDEDLIYNQLQSLPKTLKRILSLDTRFRTSSNESSTSFTYVLPEVEKDVVKMRVGNIEMPATYYTISEKLGNNKMLIISDATTSITYWDISTSWHMDTQIGTMNTTSVCGTLPEDANKSIVNDYNNNKTTISYDLSMSPITTTIFTDSSYSDISYSDTTYVEGTMPAPYGLGNNNVNGKYSSGLPIGDIRYAQLTTINGYKEGDCFYETKTIKLSKYFNDWVRMRERFWDEYDASNILLRELDVYDSDDSENNYESLQSINTMYPAGNPNRNDIDVSGNTETTYVDKKTKYESISTKSFKNPVTGEFKSDFNPLKRAWLVKVPDGYYDSELNNITNAETKINEAISLALPGAVDHNDNFAAFDNPHHSDWLNYKKFNSFIFPTPPDYSDIKFNIQGTTSFTVGSDDVNFSVVTQKFLHTDEMAWDKNGGTQFGNSENYSDSSLNGGPYEQVSQLYNEARAPSVTTFNIGTNPKLIKKIRFNIDNYGNIDNNTNMQLKLGWMLGFRTNETEIVEVDQAPKQVVTGPTINISRDFSGSFVNYQESLVQFYFQSDDVIQYRFLDAYKIYIHAMSSDSYIYPVVLSIKGNYNSKAFYCNFDNTQDNSVRSETYRLYVPNGAFSDRNGNLNIIEDEYFEWVYDGLGPEIVISAVELTETDVNRGKIINDSKTCLPKVLVRIASPEEIFFVGNVSDSVEDTRVYVRAPSGEDTRVYVRAPSGVEHPDVSFSPIQYRENRIKMYGFQFVYDLAVDGPYGVTVPPGSFVDAYNNPSEEEKEFDWNYDRTIDINFSVRGLNITEGSPLNIEASNDDYIVITFTITDSKNGGILFNAEGIGSDSNGTFEYDISNSGNGRFLEDNDAVIVTFTPENDATHYITVSDAFQDAGGNFGDLIAFEWRQDRTSPRVDISASDISGIYIINEQYITEPSTFPLLLAFKFSEPVPDGYNFSETDISSTIGVINDFSGVAANYTAEFSVPDGTYNNTPITITVADNIFTNHTGNTSIGGIFTFYYDNIHPSVNITARNSTDLQPISNNAYTNKQNIDVLFTFSESVNNTTLQDLYSYIEVNVNNTGYNDISENDLIHIEGNTTYKLELNTSDGLYNVALRSGFTFSDTAGNQCFKEVDSHYVNDFSDAIFTITRNTARPTIDLSGTFDLTDLSQYTTPPTTGVDRPNLKLILSKDISNSNYTLIEYFAEYSTESTILSITELDSTIWDLSLQSIDHGLQTIKINSGAFEDYFGNTNDAAQFRWFFDNQAKIVKTILYRENGSIITNGSFTNDTYFKFQISLSDVPQPYNKDKIKVIRNSNETFDVSFVTQAETDICGNFYYNDISGNYTFTISGDLFRDKYDNISDPIESNIMWLNDQTQPSVVVSASRFEDSNVTFNSQETTNDNKITLLFEFETTLYDICGNPTTMVINDISFASTSGFGKITNFENQDDVKYSFDFAPINDHSEYSDDTYDIYIDNTFYNIYGSLFNINNFNWSYDSTNPTLNITSPDVSNGGVTSTNVINFVFSFSELPIFPNSTEFSANHVTIKAITPEKNIVTEPSGISFYLNKSSDLIYTSGISTNLNEVRDYVISVSAFQDSVGLYSVSDISFSWTYDPEDLSLDITSTELRNGDNYTTNTVDFVFEWNKEVDFSSSHISTDNGRLADFSISSDFSNTYLVQFQSTDYGRCEIKVAADEVSDSAGNLNTAVLFEWTYVEKITNLFSSDNVCNYLFGEWTNSRTLHIKLEFQEANQISSSQVTPSGGIIQHFIDFGNEINYEFDFIANETNPTIDCAVAYDGNSFNWKYYQETSESVSGVSDVSNSFESSGNSLLLYLNKFYDAAESGGPIKVPVYIMIPHSNHFDYSIYDGEAWVNDAGDTKDQDYSGNYIQTNDETLKIFLISQKHKSAHIKFFNYSYPIFNYNYLNMNYATHYGILPQTYPTIRVSASNSAFDRSGTTKTISTEIVNLCFFLNMSMSGFPDISNDIIQASDLSYGDKFINSITPVGDGGTLSFFVFTVSLQLANKSYGKRTIMVPPGILTNTVGSIKYVSIASNRFEFYYTPGTL